MISRFEPTYKGEVRSPMSKRSFYSLLSVAVVGALLAIMIFPLSLFAHENPDTDHEEADHVHFPENGTGEVRDFDSKDPEGAGITWAIRGVDAADFTIDGNGVLSFVSPPDFENPTDQGFDANNDDNFTDAASGDFAPDDNDYQITVSATERWDGVDESLPAKRTDRDFTVTVTNANDPGEFTLQWLQPEVGTAISAELSDEDGTVVDSGVLNVGGQDIATRGYTWYISKVPNPQVGVGTHWNPVVTQPNSDTYIPVEADANADAPRFLRAQVVYTDPQSESSPRTLNVVSEYAVRGEVDPQTSGSPDFGEREEDTRTVFESVAVGADVGAAVAANDRSEDILTYELIAAGAPNANDVDYFNIDRATGQLTVAKKLDADKFGDRDGNGTDDTGTAGDYVVIVRATDPSALLDNITVTVTAEDVNEAPEVTGRSVLTLDENAEFPTTAGSQNEYNVKQEDVVDSVASWRLEGDDAAAFTFSTGEPIHLTFIDKPDFESPTDANSDNVYEVTIVARDDDPLDTGAEEGRKDVWVVVNNVDEDGEVVFVEGDTAFLNQELVAEVHDKDDHGGDPGEPYQGVHVVSWQWSRSDTVEGTFEDIPGETRNRYTPTITEGDEGKFLRVTATYTDPFSAADNPATEPDERVTGTVTDTGTDSGRTTSLVTESLITDYAVRRELAPGDAPTFPSSASTRSVAENTPAGGNVGDAVKADLPGAALVYSLLDGTDRKYFNIDSGTGQITVGGDAGNGEAGTDPELDYEDGRRAYSVTVKATVQGGETQQVAQVTVTITVTDVDEPLTVKKAGDEDAPNLPGAAPEAESYPEIKAGAPNTDAVVTYIGADPEGARVSWDLKGADASFFTIDGGVLRFRTPPDFENARDRADTDDETATPEALADGIYSVQVRAIAGRASDYTGPAQTVEFLVNVTVGDVDEPGTIVLSRLKPEVELAAPDNVKTITLPGGDMATVTLDTEIEATLYDPDAVTDDNPTGAVTDVVWAWTVSKVTQGLDLGEEDDWEVPVGTPDNASTYTPRKGATDSEPTDKGDYLRVVATYTDGTPSGVDDDIGTNINESTNDVVRVRSLYVVQKAGRGICQLIPRLPR